MNADLYFYAFKFMSGAFAFTLLTLVLRSFGEEKQAIDSDGDGYPDDERWFGLEELEIIDIYEETSDIKTFKLKRAQKKQIPKYAPGQFLSFEIPSEKKVFRSYSVSGSPENNNYLQVSIKKITDGLGSNWFHSLKVGDKVKAHPPSGLFTDQGLAPEVHRVFIAGGIGITPLFSMLRAAIDRGEKHPVTLFFAAKTKRDLAFHNQILEIAKRNKNVTYIPILSGEVDSSWTGLRGRLNLEILQEHVPDLRAAKFFFCGPKLLTKSISENLIEFGVHEDNLYSEEFVSPTSISEEDLPQIETILNLDGSDYEYSGKLNLLEFFESKEVDIPFACRSGVCGACKVKCLSGEVLSLSESGLTKDEQRQNYILTCVSWPKKRLELESK
ncbi:MAG: hypothetical protein CME65_01850 [Halobacteriovoraceae bacterium]|nr:hypothetical protein [Halobacteriovoraceae bacterium]|tara:strand:+ start:5708 stop:6862 length:1155 start_codon:yes stop_codon:yes gene_type:complete